ncbi:hypothetical protein PV08_01941 [Exophiala spinifera]|uniref:Uncharacterized protein n=1 Tax=Exophiala spinifera TaxID=91928 RepID=A0A0D1Z123_9EURO|nr:uncharacterized protein PV08_01941 [Exophiala spinifera]KIW21361.1 hypothetical protein PV08_01941 [Exophiala spinifera]
MPPSTEIKRFYLRAPDLEYSVDGPIKIGNVLSDITLPQDPITFFAPLSNVVSGVGYGKGEISKDHHASLNVGLSAKIYDVFGAQADAETSGLVKTTYAFDEIVALHLQTNPTAADVKQFRENDVEFKNALQKGPVFVVTGLKIVKGLRYLNERSNQHGAQLSGQAHVTDEISLGGNLGGDRGRRNKETWTALGEPILAYRLHVIAKRGRLWPWRGQNDDATIQTFSPGDVGFMGLEDELDEFEAEIDEVGVMDIESFAQEQEYKGVRYVDSGSEEDAWSFALLEE